MTTATTANVLSEELLARCGARAPGYDQENRFFHEDFEELTQAGYLTMAVPTELGGRGLTLAEAMREQRRLAYHAHATALAVNMHLYWVGAAADLWRAGDRSLEFLLRGAMAGEVYAAGHAESGNDLGIVVSTTKAERVDGGYRFTGRKSFGSLGPVWTKLGLHGMDTSDPAAPKIVHAFADRGAPGLAVQNEWDVLGMRATQSYDTVLDGVFVPDAQIAKVVPAGAAGVDAFLVTVIAWALLGFGNIYHGLAQHAIDLTVPRLKERQPIGLTRPYGYHPEYQHLLAEMIMELEGIGVQLDGVAADWSNGVDHGHYWAVKLIAAKYHAVEGAWKIVDSALELAGGFGIFRAAGLERLFRDARLGRIHPMNATLAREFVAKGVLGISLDEQPRWG